MRRKSLYIGTAEHWSRMIKGADHHEKHSSKVTGYNKWGYIFLLPFMLVFIVFQLIPLVNTIYNSFF